MISDILFDDSGLPLYLAQPGLPDTEYASILTGCMCLITPEDTDGAALNRMRHGRGRRGAQLWVQNRIRHSLVRQQLGGQ